MAEELKGNEQELEQEEGGKPEEEKGGAKYTDDDLDRIIAKKFAKWEAAKAKEVDEAKKLERMNAQQKAEYERDQLQAQLNELLAKDARATMLAESRRTLSEAGINASDDLIGALINSKDAEATKAAVDAFVVMYNDAVKKGIAEAMKGKTPKTGGGATLTKADILKIADRVERQRLINENLELFKH